MPAETRPVRWTSGLNLVLACLRGDVLEGGALPDATA